MRTITFYSYKGGVGRSLALANIATRLAEFGQKVCLLDFDLEAPGLHYKFSTHLSNQKIVIDKGIVDYIYHYTNEGKLSSKISDFSYKFLNYNSYGAAADTILIPAGNTDSSDYWKKLSAINWNELLFENASGLAFLLSLKEKIQNEISPDFLLIDSRTGISEMSGITLSLLANEVVVIAANNRENIEGAKKIIRSITDEDYNIFGKVPKVTFVLSRIPFTDNPEDRAKEQSLVEKVGRELSITDVNVIHSDRELEENEQIKIGYQKDGKDPQVSRDYLKLFEKLTVGLIRQELVDNLKNIKEAERQYQMASDSSNPIMKRLDHINKAVELNPHNKEFFIYRANLHKQMGDLDNVIADCDSAIKLDTGNIRAYELYGETKLELKEYNGAKGARWAFELILSFEPNHIGARIGLAQIDTIEGNLDKAMSIYNEVIKLDGENVAALTGRANIKIITNNYQDALEDVYKALSYDAEHVAAFAALAEINAHSMNVNEFYLNLERALKLDYKWMENFLKGKRKKLPFSEKRFEKLVEKYDLHLENNESI
jgi:MinD-like ATPase involved in chromosome partitioning or flagellar assembly